MREMERLVQHSRISIAPSGRRHSLILRCLDASSGYRGVLGVSLRPPQRSPVPLRLSLSPSTCEYFVHMGHSYTLFRTREAIIRHRLLCSMPWLLRKLCVHCWSENMDQGRRHQTRCTVALITPWAFPIHDDWSCSQHGHRKLACSLGTPSTHQLRVPLRPDPALVIVQ
jgi:hypothetical protein